MMIMMMMMIRHNYAICKKQNMCNVNQMHTHQT